MLGSIDSQSGVIVADLEAGIGTLTRLGHAQLDVVLVVVEPTPRSIEVGQRAMELAVAGRQGRVVVVANQLMDVADEATIREAFPGFEMVAVPADKAVAAADRVGLSLLDVAPDGPAARALLSLAASLDPRAS